MMAVVTERQVAATLASLRAVASAVADTKSRAEAAKLRGVVTNVCAFAANAAFARILLRNDGVGALLPEGQKPPTAQGVIAVVALSLPSGHVKPGKQSPKHVGSIWPGARSAPTSGHGPLQAGVFRPVVLPKVKLGQKAGVLVPATQ